MRSIGGPSCPALLRTFPATQGRGGPRRRRRPRPTPGGVWGPPPAGRRPQPPRRGAGGATRRPSSWSSVRSTGTRSVWGCSEGLCFLRGSAPQASPHSARPSAPSAVGRAVLRLLYTRVSGATVFRGKPVRPLGAEILAFVL